MKVKTLAGERELDGLLPTTKAWLLQRGYVSRDENEELHWTMVGIRWIINMKGGVNESQGSSLSKGGGANEP